MFKDVQLDGIGRWWVASDMNWDMDNFHRKSLSQTPVIHDGPVQHPKGFTYHHPNSLPSMGRHGRHVSLVDRGYVSRLPRFLCTNSQSLEGLDHIPSIYVNHHFYPQMLEPQKPNLKQWGSLEMEISRCFRKQTSMSYQLNHENSVFSIYHLVMTVTVRHGTSPFSRTVNHLFLWAIYTMAM